MPPPSPERAALKVLIDTYWSSGWRPSPSTTRDALRLATAAGLMFDPRPMSHDEVVEEAIAARDALSRTEVVRGFRYSLTSRRLDLRSALGSFAATLNLQPHGFVRWDGVTCAVCGTTQTTTGDHNVLNFERFKWGGVRHFKASVAVASNLPFSEWGTVIPDPRLVAAIVDRVTFNAHILETGTDSYRLRSTRTRTRRKTA